MQIPLKLKSSNPNLLKTFNFKVNNSQQKQLLKQLFFLIEAFKPMGV